MRTRRLRDWHRLVILPGVTPNKPGIYAWVINRSGEYEDYLGKYTHSRRPLKEYGCNVGRLRAGLPYRAGKEAEYRRVHKALEQAVADCAEILLFLLENVPPHDLARRERELIKKFRPSLND